MHLLIDLRIPLGDSHIAWYARAWISTYARIFPEDHLTLLILPGDLRFSTLGLDSLEVVMDPSWWTKRRYQSLTRQSHGDICLSFSPSPYFPFSMGVFHHGVALTRFYRLEALEEHIHPRKGDFYLLSSPQKKKEFLDSYETHESRLILSPLWYPHEDKSPHPTQKRPYFLHDAGWGDETHLDRLIEYFSRETISYDLVIIGRIEARSTRYRDMIRALGKLDRIRIETPQSEAEMRDLYLGARGWIMIGYHHSREDALARAIASRLPLFLSDLRDFDLLTPACLVHPSRPIDDLDLTREATPHMELFLSDEGAMREYRRIFEKTGKK